LQELQAIHADSPANGSSSPWLGRTDRLVGDCAAHVQANDPRQAKIGSTRAPEHQGYG